MNIRHRAALPAALVALSLAVAACGGGDEEPASSEPSATPTPEAAPETWPMTGLEVTGKQSAEQDRPVLVLKMDNTPSSSPQEGLSHADLVVEELVEGGVTRLAAFYYSDLPGEVGPVRSMRASDIGIVSPVDATVVTSGAAPVTYGRLKEAGVTWKTEGSAGFYRASDRRAPYNLMADLTKVAKGLEDGEAARPDDYLPWGTGEDVPAGRKATTIAADFGSHTTQWSFSKKSGYVNQNSNAPAEDQFPADTVLVLRVPVGDAGYKDPAGNPVPESKFDSTGDALLFHGGRVVKGTWTKDGADAPLELSTADGDLTVPAGHVWIELVPNDASGGSLTFGK
ncbi:DUF3048 domain-containing protein [Nocardioides sp. GY 10113]|uniref:DUF3048 domain-containing protein n=1 Tax=Nocardioides sp. GY 10113 TaxID=2569761 RepID=UPI00145893EE|nr:DUF3048 domain-containing protein [Nocardioides sp. GY 10113]